MTLNSVYCVDVLLRNTESLWCCWVAKVTVATDLKEY